MECPWSDLAHYAAHENLVHIFIGQYSKEGVRGCKIDGAAQVKELLWTMAKQGQGTNKVRFRAELMGKRVNGSEIWLTVKSISSWTNWKKFAVSHVSATSFFKSKSHSEA